MSVRNYPHVIQADYFFNWSPRIKSLYPLMVKSGNFGHRVNSDIHF